jgi:hypothetical protein
MLLQTYIQSYAKVAELLLACAAVSYFLTFHSALSPPLKPRQAVYAISVLVEVSAVVVGYNAMVSTKPKLKLMIFCILFYLIALFSLTFLIATSDSSYREAIGFVCKKEFLDLYGPSCYWIEPKILAKASFEPDRIWEYWSIEIVRLFLSAAWLAMVWAVVSAIAISMRKQRNDQPRRAPPPSKPMS